jgi:hypothetical protein
MSLPSSSSDFLASPGLYDILSVTDVSQRIKYVVVTVTIFIAVISYVSPHLTFGYILALMLITTLLPVLYGSWKNGSDTFMKEMDFKISTIDPDDRYNFLYIDANLVNLLYSIYDFKTLAPDNYDDLLEVCNNFLHLRNDFDTGLLTDSGDQYLNAEYLARKAANQMHTFIYSLPNKTYYDLFDVAFERIRIILRRQLDVMAQIAEKEPLNIKKTFIPNATDPRPMSVDVEDISERVYNVIV